MKTYHKGNYRVEIEKKQGQKGSYFTANLVKMYKTKEGAPGEFKFNMNLSDIPVIMAIFQKMSLDGVQSSPAQATQQPPRPPSNNGGWNPEPIDGEEVPF